MTDLLGNIPWYIPAALAVGALLLLNLGRQNRYRPLTLGGIVAALLAAGLAVLSSVIVTPREQALESTRAFISAVEQGKSDELRNLLQPDTAVTIQDGPTMYPNRDTILVAAEAAKQLLGLKTASIVSSEVREDVNLVAVTITVASTQDATQGRSVTSRWIFDYRPAPDGELRLRQIRLIEMPGHNLDDARARFPRAR